MLMKNHSLLGIFLDMASWVLRQGDWGRRSSGICFLELYGRRCTETKVSKKVGSAGACRVPLEELNWCYRCKL